MKQGNVTTLVLVGAIVFGLGAAWLTHWYIDSEVKRYRLQLDRELEPVAVVVAQSDLNAGAPLTHTAVAVRPVPRAFVGRDAVSPEQFAEVAGRRLSIPVNRGEPILYPYLAQSKGGTFSHLITPGKRALTFRVDDVSSQSGMIAPGDRVDLLATLSVENERVTFPLLRNIVVLATGNAVDRADPGLQELQFRTVTMAVSPRDAARIAQAQESGKLTVVLRGPLDAEEEDIGRITKATLLGLQSRAPRRTSVEIILGGKRP